MFEIDKLMNSLIFDGEGLEGGGGPVSGDVTSSDMGDVISASLEGAEGREEQNQTDKPNEEEEKELAALEKEILSKNPSMANGAIKVHRHQAVLTRQRNLAAKQQAEWQEKQRDYESQQAD